jgi:hypothetical protein
LLSLEWLWLWCLALQVGSVLIGQASDLTHRQFELPPFTVQAQFTFSRFASQLLGEGAPSLQLALDLLELLDVHIKPLAAMETVWSQLTTT